MMLRRTVLKVLGAAIAVPFIGWPAKRAARWSKWNLWIGGNNGKFDDPRCWSHRKVPGTGDSVVLNTGILVLPVGVDFDGIALIGPGTLSVTAHKGRLINSIGGLRIAKDSKGTIGEEGRPL